MDQIAPPAAVTVEAIPRPTTPAHWAQGGAPILPTPLLLVVVWLDSAELWGNAFFKC